MNLPEAIEQLKAVALETAAHQNEFCAATEALVKARQATDLAVKELSDAETIHQRLEDDLRFEQVMLAKAKDPDAKITGTNDKERDVQWKAFFREQENKDAIYAVLVRAVEKAQARLDSTKSEQSTISLRHENSETITKLLISRAGAWVAMVAALSIMEQAKGVAKQ